MKLKQTLCHSKQGSNYIYECWLITGNKIIRKPEKLDSNEAQKQNKKY